MTISPLVLFAHFWHICSNQVSYGLRLMTPTMPVTSVFESRALSTWSGKASPHKSWALSWLGESDLPAFWGAQRRTNIHTEQYDLSTIIKVWHITTHICVPRCSKTFQVCFIGGQPDFSWIWWSVFCSRRNYVCTFRGPWKAHSWAPVRVGAKLSFQIYLKQVECIYSAERRNQRNRYNMKNNDIGHRGTNAVAVMRWHCVYITVSFYPYLSKTSWHPAKQLALLEPSSMHTHAGNCSGTCFCPGGSAMRRVTMSEYRPKASILSSARLRFLQGSGSSQSQCEPLSVPIWKSQNRTLSDSFHKIKLQHHILLHFASAGWFLIRNWQVTGLTSPRMPLLTFSETRCGQTVKPHDLAGTREMAVCMSSNMSDKSLLLTLPYLVKSSHTTKAPPFLNLSIFISSEMNCRVCKWQHVRLWHDVVTSRQVILWYFVNWLCWIPPKPSFISFNSFDGTQLHLINFCLQLTNTPSNVFHVKSHILSDVVCPLCVLLLQMRHLLHTHRPVMLCLNFVELSKLGTIPCQFQTILPEGWLPGIAVQLVQCVIDSSEAQLRWRSFLDRILDPKAQAVWVEVWVFQHEHFLQLTVVVPKGGFENHFSARYSSCQWFTYFCTVTFKHCACFPWFLIWTMNHLFWLNFVNRCMSFKPSHPSMHLFWILSTTAGSKTLSPSWSTARRISSRTKVIRHMRSLVKG